MLCLRRQKTITKDRKGNTETTFRCLNKECDIYRTNVDEDTCEGCMFKVLKRDHSCVSDKPKPPAGKPCPECGEAVAKQMRDFPDGYIEGFKHYTSLAVRYKEAVKRWIKAGRPVRSETEVEQIHQEHCLKCEMYDPNKKTCRGCGCLVTEGSVAVFNKIKMATENCPKGKW